MHAKVSKTVETEAIKIESEEEFALVQKWLTEMGFPDSGHLSELVEAGVWFMRDPGDNEKVVYIVTPNDFEKNYQIKTTLNGRGFTFEE